ncbi:MAG: response regulator transcription factor [Burkholderiales bacterium]|nr:response regulator transcription factor [Burkholderiales bacterium]
MTRDLAIHVLVVDDHTIFRSGLCRLLLDEPDLHVIGEVGSGAEALEALQSARVDVLLLDINLEGRSGLDLLGAIRERFPALPVLMLSMYPQEQYAQAALQGGARGYVQKDADPDELIRAIRQVASGRLHVGARGVMPQRGDKGAEPSPLHRLTVREHQILRMLLKGMSLTGIGEEMMISVKTVSTHRSNILEKIGARNTPELVLWAVRQGIAG